jgi:dTDP-glucose 4,6-dehydratase/UDP-glucuronate decarboxylase
MDNANQVVESDLEYICNELEDEFSQMEGKKLLIVGGAGFLGYYLVQAVLHWNSRTTGAAIALTAFDNYSRGIPPWLAALEGNANLKLSKHDITDPLPDNMDDFSFIVHAASIASPIYYRQFPIETMDANVKGLRTLLEYCETQSKTTNPVEGFAEGMLYVDCNMITLNPNMTQFGQPQIIAFHVVEKESSTESAGGDYTGNFPGVMRPLLIWETDEI